MAEYDNTNRGIIFKNDKKGNEKAPEYTGKGNFKGTDFEISLWVKKDKNGKSYFSVSFKEPYKKEQPKDDFPAQSDPGDLPY